MKAIVAAAYMRRGMPFPQIPKLHVETAQPPLPMADCYAASELLASIDTLQS